MATINDRVQFVQLALGNRSDLSNGDPTRIENWLADSYTDIANSVCFSELEDTSNLLTVPDIGEYAYDSSWRAVQGIILVQSSGATIPLDYKDIRYVRRYSTLQSSVPSVFADRKQTLYLRPIPDNTYTLLVDVWLKPQITPTAAGPPATHVRDTVLNIPDDWLEIIDMGAEMRGHAALLERDRAQELQQLLFGYNDPRTGRITPGLIKAKLTRRQATAPTMDYGLAPRQTKRSYTNVG